MLHGKMWQRTARMGLLALGSPCATSARRRSLASWELACEWIAAHPDAAVAVTALVVPAAMAGTAIWQQEVRRRRQLEVALSKQSVAMEEMERGLAQDKTAFEAAGREKELHQARLEVELQQGREAANEQLKRLRQGETELTSQLTLARMQLTASETKGKEVARREHLLADAKAKVEMALREAMDREKRLQSSIAHRGALGEQALMLLLDEAKRSEHTVSYELKPLVNGKRPDAVVQLVGGRAMVVDSKAPQPPDMLLETGDVAARRSYVETLKRHIAELAAKRYHADVILTQGLKPRSHLSPSLRPHPRLHSRPRSCPHPSPSPHLSLSPCPNPRYHADVPASLPWTWLLLPGEGYLRAVYDVDGVDSHNVHAFAHERGVALVGPNGLRSALQMWLAITSEQGAQSRLEDESVQGHLQSIQRQWHDKLLPRSRAMGKDLGKVVAEYNEVAVLMRSFDQLLRHEEVLNLPKVRKTSLPPTVRVPAEEHAEDDPEACTSEALPRRHPEAVELHSGKSHV